LHEALDLLKRGSLSYDQLPPDDASCDPPTLEQNARTNDFKIEDYQMIERDDADLDQFIINIKGQLAADAPNPVIFSLHVTDAFKQLRPGQIYNHPTTCKGDCYHAITAVGYDDDRKAFKLINSWGPDWADGGFAWVAYETTKTEVDSAFIMRVVPAVRFFQ
jgi:C1A family cysteine protease